MHTTNVKIFVNEDETFSELLTVLTGSLKGHRLVDRDIVFASPAAVYLYKQFLIS